MSTHEHLARLKIFAERQRPGDTRSIPFDAWMAEAYRKLEAEGRNSFTDAERLAEVRAHQADERRRFQAREANMMRELGRKILGQAEIEKDKDASR